MSINVTMTPKEFINLFGLILDIAGVMIVYKYAVTRLIGRGSQLQNTPDGTTDPEREKTVKKHKCYEKAGMLLIVFGFLLQIISIFI